MRAALSRGIRKRLAVAVVRHSMRCSWAAIHVRGAEVLQEEATAPALFCANHLSIWDAPLAAYLTSTLFGRDPFIMGAEITMVPIAAWIGVFSVDTLDPTGAAKSLVYTVDLLKADSNRAVWMFPQGVIEPFHRRPLEVQPGAAFVARKVPGVRIVPVALHYTFSSRARPEAFVSFGGPFSPPPSMSAQHLASEIKARLTAEVDGLQDDIAAHRTDRFSLAVKGSDDIVDLGARLLRWRRPPLATWGRWYDPARSGAPASGITTTRSSANLGETHSNLTSPSAGRNPSFTVPTGVVPQ